VRQKVKALAAEREAEEITPVGSQSFRQIGEALACAA
jgi:hypothetical protein